MPKQEIPNIPENVLGFLDRCSRKIGELEEESFNMDTWRVVCDLESPIEQLLYIAVKAIQRFNYIPDFHFDLVDKIVWGLMIWPQQKINPYRVDFLVGWNEKNSASISKTVIECDSQEFHERDERERRYEKRRDRFLISKGYKILHYTGKEIIENPLTIAAEILHLVTGREINSDWE